MTHAILFAAATDAPTRKDVVIATFGASAALCGLALVSLTLVVSVLERPSASVPAGRGLGKAGPRVGFSLVTLLGTSIFVMAGGLAWLVWGNRNGLYLFIVALFFIELAAIFALFMTTLDLLAEAARET